MIQLFVQNLTWCYLLAGCRAELLAELWQGCSTDAGFVALESEDTALDPPSRGLEGAGGPAGGVGWGNTRSRQRQRTTTEEEAEFGTVS